MGVVSVVVLGVKGELDVDRGREEGGNIFFSRGRKSLNTIGREALKEQWQQHCPASRWLAHSTAIEGMSIGHVTARLFRHVEAWTRSGAGAWQPPTEPRRRQVLRLSSHIRAFETNDSSHQTNPPRSTRTRASLPFFFWYTFLLRSRHRSFRHPESVASCRRKDSRLAEWHPRVHHNEIWLARLREASL